MKKRIAAAVALALFSAGVAWAFSMGTNTDYATGVTPSLISTGDLRGVGKLDLVVSSSGTNKASVLLGNGDGTFVGKVDYTTGTNPKGIVLGDLRGVGKLDIVVCNQGSNTISVLLGNGDGTFAAKVDYTTGASPKTVALGSLKNNGKLDAVVTNSGTNTISVLLGNGDGTFNTKTDYTVGTQPIGVALGDLRNVGKLDVAAANGTSNTVSVLLGNGDGTLAAKVDYAVEAAPDGVIMGDWNDDNKLDVAVAHFGAGAGGTGDVVTLLGNGDGTLKPYAIAFGQNAFVFLKAGDLHGNGHLDLVAANNNGAGTANVQIGPGNGDGTYGTTVSLNATADLICNDVCLGDFNGDGKLDIAAVNQGTANLSVWLQTTADVRGETPGSVLIFSGLPNPAGSLPRRTNGEHATTTTVKGE